MILATVSKVEDISKSLIGHAFPQPRRHVCDCGWDRRGAARLPRPAVASPYSEEAAQVQWRAAVRASLQDIDAVDCYQERRSRTLAPSSTSGNARRDRA